MANLVKNPLPKQLSGQALRGNLPTAIDFDIGSGRVLGRDIFDAFLLASIIAALTMFWFSFDSHLLSQDEAEHLINSMSFRDLLTHCHPLSYHWWYQCLTVNRFYPPFAYLVNGSFLLVFGQSRFVEQFCLAFFTGLMVAAVYLTVRLLAGTRLAASLSAICICLYPTISVLSHSFLLDLPAVAMTAVALMTLVWWRNQWQPNWLATLLTGIVLGCACLTKQLVAVYLIPVALYFLLIDSGLINRKPKFNWLLHTLLVGLTTTFIVVPFIIISHQCTLGLTQSLTLSATQAGKHMNYLHKVILYCQLLLRQMSPFLLAVFLFSALNLSWQRQKLLLPLTISAIGGIALTCTSIWTDLVLDPRYISLCSIAPAVYSGFFLADLFLSYQLWKQAIATVIVLLAAANYLFYNFVPYPLPLALMPEHDHSGNPVIAADWGYDKVLETIEKVDGSKPVYLNVLGNSTILHPHFFELLLKEKKNTTITPTSSRSWTILGDKVQFSPTTALYSQWYLLEKGNSDRYFCDKESESNFNSLVKFISTRYNLILTKTQPNGNKLNLYRRWY